MRFLIVGLGNPGAEYENTRHNAGFHAVDALGEQLGVRYWKTKCGGLLATALHGSNEIILLKPQSFMNVSGGPVKTAANLYDVQPDHIIVIHDEMDLDPGTVRIKRGGGHAGHNGLRSIHEKLGTGDYPRVRVGTGKPANSHKGANFVLAQLRGAELQEFEDSCSQAAAAALAIVDDGIDTAMNHINVRDKG